MGIFSRSPITTDQIIARMRDALDAGGRNPRRYVEVTQLRDRLGDDNARAAAANEAFWLNALPVVAVLRWGASVGAVSGMMEAIHGFYGWLGSAEPPAGDSDAQALRNEIERRIADA